MLLAVCISSYGCTWEVWRALNKLEFLLAIALSNSNHMLLSCSPNFQRASKTRYTHAKHELILNFTQCISSKNVDFRSKVLNMLILHQCVRARMSEISLMLFSRVRALAVVYLGD